MLPKLEICQECKFFESNSITMGYNGYTQYFYCNVDVSNRMISSAFGPVVAWKSKNEWERERDFEVPVSCPYNLEHLLDEPKA